jgi:plasmid stabilization system protein ParE
MMAFQYRLHPLAQEEYESSVSWYLKRSVRAATNFVNAIDKGLASICNDPKRYRNEYKNYYEFNTQKYPFTIVYTIEESLHIVLIIAVYHQKRQPENKYR